MRHVFYRIGIIFALLITVGTGTAWGWSYTVYCVPKAIWGADWTEGSNIVKVLWKTENNSKEFLQQMSKTSYTYEGEYIYEYTIYDLSAEGADKLEYQRYSSEDKFENYHTVFGSYWGHDGFENKIFRGEWEYNNPIMRTFGRDITFYAVPESMDGSKWDEGSHTLYADIKYGDSEWKKVQMTKSAYDYNGNPIYTCMTLIPYNVIKQIKFYYNDGSDHDLYDCNPSTQYGTNDLDGKILLGWNGSHNWVYYGRDVTIYTIPDYLFKDFKTPYDESIHYPAVCIQMGTGSTWNTVNMTKTSYTYATYPIYKATILIDQNKFWEYQIKYFKKSDNTQVDLYQFNQFEPKTEYAPSYIDDKLYHGWNGLSHDFFSYRYDVALDMQSGGGGSTSIIAIDGSAMPSATMPGRDGYIFGGYWTETNGGGTQYYNADGSSTRNWDSRTITTLYAKWTARKYTVKLEDMEPTTAGQGSVTVTFDASTNMTSAVTKPTKTNYTFDGYWTDNDDEGANLVTQLIDTNGYWKKDISTYTGHDGSDNPTWIYPNDKSLFAKWNEDLHTVNVAVSPVGAGSVQISSSDISKVENIGIATKSDEMTAVPANAAWVFKEWQISSNDVHLDLETYTTTGTTMKINATANGQTLTAVFEPRYYLVGGEIMSGEDGVGTGTSSGMPGWDNYNKPFEIVTNSPILATCSLTLGTNKNFYIMVRDKADGFSYGKSGGVSLGDGTSLKFENKDNRVFFYSNGGTAYTFKITDIDGSGRPTVSVERPYQVNIGRKRVDIDGNDHDDNTGGTVDLSKQTAPETWTPISNGDWVPYGISVKYNASKEDGYTLDWYTASDYATQFSTEPYWFHTATSTGNGYAKFTEKSTSVTLANDGNGKVQIGGADATSTTCGVTTTRELTAVPNEGYKFSSWSKSGDDITLSSFSTNPTTLSGNGSGATSGQTVTANFEERYSIKGTMNGENWGTTHTLSNIGTNAGSKDTCYVTMTLPANTTYEFAIYDEQTGGWYKAGTDAVYDMTYTNHTNWEFGDTKTYNCGITTAGKGTYKFIFNITDKTVTVVYPTSYQVNYGAAVGGNITVVDDDSQAVPNGGYVREGGSVTYEATASDGYTFTGWCPNDSYGDTFTDHNPWENSNITATSNAYAKFHSTNFVIYRTGDMSSDPRAAYDDVESYDGGTISETIEFRMRVNRLDKWYTLCLPFEVNAVQVWDEEDYKYYDLEPYYRTGDKYCTGHYIIRTPLSTTDFAIENFDSRDRWVDPSSAVGYLPSANTPYIIQWHDSWFQDKYISFFGPTGASIPTSMNQGANTSSDETVNIYGNNCMTSGTVRDAYMLDPDYGSGGAWLRAEVGTDRTVLPFECFIRANATTTAKYRVLRRDMADTPTGWDTVSETENKTTKVLIDNNIYIIRGDRMYTIQGTLVKEGK